MHVKCAHAASLVRAPSSFWGETNVNMACCFRNPVSFLGILVIVLSVHFTVTSAASAGEILIKFKSNLSNTSALTSWNDNSEPCNDNRANWRGVICVNGSLWGLQLENMGLSGKIDVETLEGLPDLRSISFKDNLFQGQLPDLKKDTALRSIYFSNNKFSGEIPGNTFQGMQKLRKVYLSGNQFTGAIPSSLVSLPRLKELRLDRNGFIGQIPNFKQQFVVFNVSRNNLEGSIPASLSTINGNSFSGNKGLCGKPLVQCISNSTDALNSTAASNSASSFNSTGATISSGGSIPSGASTPQDTGSNKGSRASIIIIVVVGVTSLLGIGSAIIIVCRRKTDPSSLPVSMESPAPPSNLQRKAGLRELEHGQSSTPDHLKNGKKTDAQKLSFVRDDREKFDLPDLLKASAEILGSGCFGSSYKAALTTGSVMVVKRFKQMNNVGKEEFQEHMRRLGRLTHHNLLPLVAYYYRKEEKLLVTDFVANGSLAVHLHGNQTLGQPSLDWATRLKIVKGVSRGLAYLYKELPSIISAHGHLKSSNVLLDESFEPLLTDYGLVPVINHEDAQELMVAYKSPEYSQHGRITKKTDVWSLGMLILELLTGKFPANFLQKGKGSEDDDLANWVRSVAPEQWNTVVFDKEMGSIRGCEGEMVKLLKLAILCCQEDVERRPELKEAVEKIEELKERDMEDDHFSSCASDGDAKSSRGKSDDFNFT